MPNDPTEETLHTEPSVRSWNSWDPQRIRIAEQQADAGYLRLAADLCEEMFADDRVQGVLGARTLGLAQLPVTFEDGAGPSLQRARATKALEAYEDWYTIAPENQLAQVDRWGVMLGVCPVQKKWVAGSKGRPVPTLDPWHPRGLRCDKGKWTIETDDAGAVEITPGTQWALYTPMGRKRPWVHGAWRPVARWWLLKKYARDDWGDHGSKAAGKNVVTTPKVDGAAATTDKNDAGNDGKRKRLAQDIMRMARNGSLVLPPGWDLKIAQAAANTHDTFRAQIEMADKGIAIALAGQNLSSEVSGGSFAAAQVHAIISNVFLAADAEFLSTWFHDEMLGEWAEYNFGSRALAPWPSWDTTPPENQLQKMQTLVSAADAANKWNALLAPIGKQVDVEDLARGAGLKITELKEQAKVIQLFAYHLQYGLVTKNEARGTIGFGPVSADRGGDDFVTLPGAQLPAPGETTPGETTQGN